MLDQVVRLSKVQTCTYLDYLSTWLSQVGIFNEKVLADILNLVIAYLCFKVLHRNHFQNAFQSINEKNKSLIF